jgi:outer membrane protein
MKKSLLLITLLSISSTLNAADLIQVYQQALFSDPVYQQAVSQRLADNENAPIARSVLFPQAAINGGPSLSKFRQNAAQGSPAIATTSRGYSFTLSLSQTVFNYTQFKTLSGANAISKEADATLNAATQSLMLRVAQAYFTVLKDEDNLIYNEANKKAFNKQYDQINQQYKVGLKTVTDVYTAKASYDTASAAYIAAQTTLADDKENLRAITGNIYPTLATLSKRFPLISPQPADMDEWVQTAEQQNWSIKAAQFANIAARENVKQQLGGHLPTVSVQGAYNVAYNNNLTGSPVTTSAGGSVQEPTPFLPPTKAHTSDASVTLNLGVPIFQGGLVVAQTNQARYNYQTSTQKLEQAIRGTINTTRQSYLGVMSGIQQINADKQAIKSTISSMEGLQAGYRVGTQTLVDVLNQQQKVFQAETQYATDRYAYVNNLLSLKQAAGTLSEVDLQAINAWLIHRGSNADDADFENNSDKNDDNTLTETHAKHHVKTAAKKTTQEHTVTTAELSKLPSRISLAQLDDVNAKINQHLAKSKMDMTLSP